MAILINSDTRMICQGLTGRAGQFHTAAMIAYGTQVVGGVTPGKGGRQCLDRPIFDTVRDAVWATNANASMVFAPPDRAADAMIEAIEADVPLVVCVTERVPMHDMARVRDALAGSNTRLVGPNSQGVLSPSAAQLGVMSTIHSQPGVIGVASRSASLTSEIVAQTTRLGLGQSTTVGVGGDPIHGLSLADCVQLFLDDDATKGVILIGEIGGSDEEAAADLIAELRPDKPIVALVVGRHAPQQRRMGHAGALIAAGQGTAAGKIEALRAAGVIIALDAGRVGEAMLQALSTR